MEMISGGSYQQNAFIQILSGKMKNHENYITLVLIH